MLNFGASKPRVKGGPGPWGPPGSAPDIIGHLIVPIGEDSSAKINKIRSENIIYLSIGKMLFAEIPWTRGTSLQKWK